MGKPGRIALVGSGEYLPVMQEFESELLRLGPSLRFIQIPTAAGRESETRLKYWEQIGKDQADRIGAEQIFLPIFSRHDAMREDLASQIDGAGLIYLSGGDPHYLAETLSDTPVWAAVMRNWLAGSSLAGCSAGAMALGPDIPNFRKMKEEGSQGLAILQGLRTIPHYNKFFGWIPEFAAQKFLKAPEDVTVVGIDEESAIWSDDLTHWHIYGKGSAHILTGANSGKYSHGTQVEIINK